MENIVAVEHVPKHRYLTAAKAKAEVVFTDCDSDGNESPEMIINSFYNQVGNPEQNEGFESVR